MGNKHAMWLNVILMQHDYVLAFSPVSTQPSGVFLNAGSFQNVAHWAHLSDMNVEIAFFVCLQTKTNPPFF